MFGVNIAFNPRRTLQGTAALGRLPTFSTLMRHAAPDVNPDRPADGPNAPREKSLDKSLYRRDDATNPFVLRPVRRGYGRRATRTGSRTRRGTATVSFRAFSTRLSRRVRRT